MSHYHLTTLGSSFDGGNRLTGEKKVNKKSFSVVYFVFISVSGKNQNEMQRNIKKYIILMM